MAMWLQGLEPLTGVPSGAILQFRQRWYSTLPDTFENNFKVHTASGPQLSCPVNMPGLHLLKAHWCASPFALCMTVAECVPLSLFVRGLVLGMYNAARCMHGSAVSLPAVVCACQSLHPVCV